MPTGLRQVTDSLARLAAVVYQNDRFYDPIRSEHRKVSFGFLSYSLPLEPESCRAWRIIWNPLFFEMVQAGAGHFRFDLATYRSLEPASRRLFLLLSKIFQRRPTSPRFDLLHLAVNVLGFSPTISAADLKKKVRRCVERLAELGVVAASASAEIFEKERAGQYCVTLQRGPYFDQKAAFVPLGIADSAVGESLAQIGFEPAAIQRLSKQYPTSILREWADITLAAHERFGPGYFKRSPAAYFVDNVQNARDGGRTAPDWWHELKKAERMQQAENDRPVTRLEAPHAGRCVNWKCSRRSSTSAIATSIPGRCGRTATAQRSGSGKPDRRAKWQLHSLTFSGDTLPSKLQGRAGDIKSPNSSRTTPPSMDHFCKRGLSAWGNSSQAIFACSAPCSEPCGCFTKTKR